MQKKCVPALQRFASVILCMNKETVKKEGGCVVNTAAFVKW